MRVYVKDYSCVLASAPLKIAQDLTSKGFRDDVDTITLGGAHIFRDDLLYLLDIPIDFIPIALDSYVFTLEGYPSLYTGMEVTSYAAHFAGIVRPILITRLVLGI
jgi:hypothetical protein